MEKGKYWPVVIFRFGMMSGLLTILPFVLTFVFVPLIAPPISSQEILNLLAMLAAAYLQFYCAVLELYYPASQLTKSLAHKIAKYSLITQVPLVMVLMVFSDFSKELNLVGAVFV